MKEKIIGNGQLDYLKKKTTTLFEHCVKYILQSVQNEFYNIFRCFLLCLLYMTVNSQKVMQELWNTKLLTAMHCICESSFFLEDLNTCIWNWWVLQKLETDCDVYIHVQCCKLCFFMGTSVAESSKQGTWLQDFLVLSTFL